MQTARQLDLMNLESKIGAAALKDDIEKLHEALRTTHDPSLDALLELRPDITEVGKRLIASLILELEFHSPGRFPPPDEDWLTIFFDELAAGTTCLEDFAKNEIALITYNYDRLLEFRLRGALMAHYGRSEEDCIAVLNQISIVHLHGDLGSLPKFALQNTVPFGPSPSGPEFRNFITSASKRIIIVHEARPETDEFNRAREILQSMRQIVMIGFGYGEKNLSRLEIERLEKNKIIYATAYGFTNSQVHYLIRKPFDTAGLTIHSSGAKCGAREFLVTNLQIFRDNS